MAKIAYCIFCDSLDISEIVVTSPGDGDIRYEYTCYECGETWSDDESEFEMGI